MKTLFLFCLLVTIIQANVPRVPYIPNDAVPELRAIGDCSKTPSKNAICKGCSEIAVCRLGIALPTVTCHSSTPYCVENSEGDYCSNSPDLNDDNCKNGRKFVCSSPGYYPDPFNCQKSYYCDVDLTKEPAIDSCPDKYVNDFDKEDCKLRSPNGDNCITMSCNRTGIFTKLGNGQFYGHCVDDTTTATPVQQIHMFQCPQNAYFNGHTCVFNCKVDGNFAIEGSTSDYYRCLGGSATRRSCRIPKPYFDPKTKICGVPPQT